MASNSSTSSSSKQSFKEEDNELALCPFKLLWSFGMNPEVSLINLTTKNRTILAYACSHAVIIYNYESKQAITLQGHQYAVRTLSVSTDGKWLLSADFENDPVVVVWDTESGVPICSLFNPHGENDLAAAKISPNAKYVVTIGNERYQKVQFWLWTYGKDEPNAIAELNAITSDRVKEITFNEDFPEAFALTADHNVIFFIWQQEKLKCNYPKICGNTRRYGIFNTSCYVSGTNRALTATTNGYILVWNAVLEKGRGNVRGGEMKHIRSIRTQKCSITVILQHNGMIVTGTSEGRINFYDLQLKILYWCDKCGLDSIRSISFDLRSTLLGPVSTVSTSDFDFDEEEDLEYEEEFEESSENKRQSTICDPIGEDVKEIEKKILQPHDNVPSTVTINLEYSVRNWDEKREQFVKLFHVPVDATLEKAPFYVDNFFISTSTGAIASMEIPTLKCRFYSQNVNASVTSLDAHPRSHYIVTGNVKGLLCLYNYEKRKLIVHKKTPPLPDLRPVLDDQIKNDNIIYVTCAQSHDRQSAISVLKYSPIGDELACGLDNGTLWLLHPITLEPLDEIPYRHSTESIVKLTFTECAEYMAYSDNTLAVAVFKRNHDSGSHLWNFIGKYRTHYAPIRDLLFGPPTSTSIAPRLFSLGEDKNLIEYDLKNSGPYPEPGLKIKEIHQIEYSAIPLSLSWYPELGIERFLMISNSEYKYRLLNDTTKMIRGTFLSPLFGAPVKHLKVLPGTEFQNKGYVIFATDKEIGLQMLPFDGNPYKMLGMIGHPSKITNICVNCDGNILFTSGYNEPCVLMWKIKLRSVDVLASLGGQSLSPYYCLIEGGRKGWLISEMKDLFYYAQILHQGENTTATRIVSEKVATKQIPNLMRAVGYYPSNEEIEILMGEVSYRNYAKTGQLVEEITFEDFVKLYINHRPAFGISLNQLQEAFHVFTNSDRNSHLDQENSVLTRKQFMNILFGKGPVELSDETHETFGEPLTYEEAFMYLKLLIGFDDTSDEMNYLDNDKQSILKDFAFLPERISYKDFVTDIMGIELPEETRADDE